MTSKKPRRRRKEYYDPGANPRPRDPLKVRKPDLCHSGGLTQRADGMKGQSAILTANAKRARKAAKRMCVKAPREVRDGLDWNHITRRLA